MGQQRIQFNVHVEQRQGSKKKMSLSRSLSLSVNEPLNPYFSVVNIRWLQKQNKRDGRKREMLLLIGDVK